jgi:dienelactone hydrolase
LDDQIALLGWLGRHIGRPRRSISADTSMGGLIAVLLAERNPARFDAVASLYGATTGGAGF